MKLTDLFLNLLFPPVCVFCKEPLVYTSTEALCPLCRSRYETEKSYPCPECGAAHGDCTCLSPLMKRRGVDAIHVGEYVKEESAVRAMILAAKDSSYEYLYRFLAEELAFAVKKRIEHYQEYVITYVPRNSKKIAAFGVDQAREGAKRLAKLLGCRFLPLFTYIDGVEQKTLSREDRAKNAKTTYELKEKHEELRGLKVILYDDVVTTGATMAACGSLLKKEGVKELVYLSFGKTYLSHVSDKGSLPKSKRKYDTAKVPF